MDNLKSFNNSNEGEDYVYSELIRDFENKFVGDEMKLNMINYMKNYCDGNFTNDVVMIIEDFNSVIKQAVQAIKSLLSENERLLQEQKLYKANNYNSIYNQDKSSISNNSKIEKIIIEDINLKNNIIGKNSDSNIKIQESIDKKTIKEPLIVENNFKNISQKEDIEPLRKPLRELFKKIPREKKIYLPNEIHKSKRKPLRMILNKHLSNLSNSNIEDNPLSINSDEIPKTHSNINSNSFYNNSSNLKSYINNNIKIFNSNISAIDRVSYSNDNISIVKSKEIEILKVTNEILKLVNIANDIKEYLVDKYINPSSLNYDIDYKEFLTKLINYKFDILILKNILKDLQNPNDKYYKRYNLTTPSYMKERNKKETSNNYRSLSEVNEAFKYNLRKYDS